MVYSLSMVSRSTRSDRFSTSSCDSSSLVSASLACQSCRSTATSIASSGLRELTFQSLPPTSIAPDWAILAIGYIRWTRSNPTTGKFRSIIHSSGTAHNAWKLATTFSSAKRPWSSGWISWRCEMWCLKSLRPWICSANSNASKIARTPPSPTAWVNTCKSLLARLATMSLSSAWG